MPTPVKQRRYWCLHLPDQSSPNYRELLELACSLGGPISDSIMGRALDYKEIWNYDDEGNRTTAVTAHCDAEFAATQAVVAGMSDEDLRSHIAATSCYMDRGSAMLVKAWYNESCKHIVDTAHAGVPAGLFRSPQGGQDNVAFRQWMRDTNTKIGGAE